MERSSTDQRVARVLLAPARTAIPAKPKAARLSPKAVSQALNFLAWAIAVFKIPVTASFPSAI